ncbi:unnamed protein product [Heligmosomoides polygyrus]|uniref:Zinc metalloproteinase n=1 Tax=Heligmosomoides polygyrus TaxID=6339 RepID=A0A183GL53_HELPZ|nr:unnamed protein product [Heligmosomoides polygyrus]
MSDGISEGTKGVSHEQERTERRVENIANGEIQEQLRTIKQDKVNEDGDSITEINDKAGVAKELFQGDILLTETQAKEIIEDIEKEARENTRTKRQAYKDSRYPDTIWSDGVNYYFHPYASYETQRAFIKGAELWERDTCIDFIYDSTATDRIVVAPGNGIGCWSSIGKVGGEQSILLGSGCEMVHIAAHEIGHALGFYHTMARHDRDYHVIIDVWNITPGWARQYNKETTDTNDNYDLPYDAGSIMHYGMRSSSANTLPTIVPYDMKHQKTLGSPFISFIDLSMMNEHYNCKALCNSSTSVTCERGGFPHPRDCQKCICPGGYGGARCTERPAGCGRTIQASTKWETLNDTLGEWWTTREDFTKCHYWIESPENTTIEVELVDFTKGFAIDGCVYAGVEIKTIQDQTLTGYRFCAPEDAGMYLRSFSNLVPIMTYNRVGVTSTQLKYRYSETLKFISPVEDRSQLLISYNFSSYKQRICNYYRKATCYYERHKTVQMR